MLRYTNRRRSKTNQTANVWCCISFHALGSFRRSIHPAKLSLISLFAFKTNGLAMRYTRLEMSNCKLKLFMC